MKKPNLFVIPKPIKAPKVRLFCFPYAGGSAHIYSDWPKHFGHDVEIVLVQLPGRAHRMQETPHDNMDDIVKELITHISYITELPYILLGHSLGSRIIYALTCKIQQLNLPLPEYFIASGSRPPHIPSEEEPTWDLEYNAFIKELEELNGTPKEILSNPELMELIVPLLRADFKVADTYLVEALPIQIPALVLKGEDEEDLTLEKALAWKDIFTEKCEVRQVPGDHFFIDQHPHIVIEHVLSIVKLVLGIITKTPSAGIKTKVPQKELTRLN